MRVRMAQIRRGLITTLTLLRVTIQTRDQEAAAKNGAGNEVGPCKRDRGESSRWGVCAARVGGHTNRPSNFKLKTKRGSMTYKVIVHRWGDCTKTEWGFTFAKGGQSDRTLLG